MVIGLGSRSLSQRELSGEIERETEREQQSGRERPRERETEKEKKEKRIYEAIGFRVRVGATFVADAKLERCQIIVAKKINKNAKMQVGFICTQFLNELRKILNNRDFLAQFV